MYLEILANLYETVRMCKFGPRTIRLLLILLFLQEALLLLIALSQSSSEIQKVMAFENVFERTFTLIESEGSLTHGSAIVEDCLSLLGNLLALNPSNQTYFREAGCVNKLAALLAGVVQEQNPVEAPSEWTLQQRDKNLWGTLAIINLFLVKGGVSTSINQMAFWQSGVMQQVLWIAFSQEFDVPIKAKVCFLCPQRLHFVLTYF